MKNKILWIILAATGLAALITKLLSSDKKPTPSAPTGHHLTNAFSKAKERAVANKKISVE